MEPRDFIPPSTYDVLLSDIKHDDLIGPIAERLEVQYLQPTNPNTISSGILYGTNCRPMVSLPIASKKFQKFINVIFLVDTGSPCLYLSQQAMVALGFKDHMPQTFDVLCADMIFEAVMSPRKGHYCDLNLIGSTFLKKARANLCINYKMNTVEVKVNANATGK